MEKQITKESALNHGYVRRPHNAHKDFYGFWADGSPDKLSKSHLYFINHKGAIRTLPYQMHENSEPVWPLAPVEKR